MARRSPTSPPHGFALSAADDRLLRSAPPAETLRWVERVVGGGARVRGVGALAGGTSSAVHAVTLDDGQGAVRECVLRRFVRADWLVEEPGLAQREAAALAIAGRSNVPVPRLVAFDGDARETDVPAVLTTRLPGSVAWSAADLPTFLARLAQPLPSIHAVPVPAAAGIPDYRPYALDLQRPPRWATLPRVWERAIEAHAGPPPRAGHAFIHRDYHPGNVLWADGAVAGVVDWVAASVGVPEADVGHCRVNLYDRFGREAADAFLALYQAASGRSDYHPYWDIVAAIGGMDAAYEERPHPEDERFLAAAVARL